MPPPDDSISALDGVRTEGAILPAHMLAAITARRAEGVSPEAYHLLAGERLPDVIAAAWTRLRAAWAAFGRALTTAPAEHRAKVTVEQWLLPLFQTLGYGRLQPAEPRVFEGRAYPVSHAWQHVPVHLVGYDVALGQRTGPGRGLAHAPPHSLLQERLNADRDVRWGFVSNGRVLRVLRDHHAITRVAFVEFDLEKIFDGELFHAFTLLWLVVHQSRVEAVDPDRTWLECWYRAAQSEGERAQERLRTGVVEALQLLGSAFLAHNPHLLRDLARDPHDRDHLSRQGLYRELLRLLYRLVFLFVAEDRGLLLRPDASLAEARARYEQHYSTARLRRVALAVRGARHPDGWRALVRVMDRLERGDDALALPALGSFLWRPEALEHLRGTRRDRDPSCDLPNEALYGAIRALCVLRDGDVHRKVDWRSLAAEELGSLYESLMELDPRVEDGPRFVLRDAHGNERKTSGSYYTPTALVECLLDHTLEPVLERARRAPDPAAAIEAITVCDPACGSGHFLTAAARRLARALARCRTGDEAPAPEALQSAMRHVVGRCIYGVDRNEMAVELCKVALWMEALEPGKPLSFLDGHLRVGNALLGARPWDVEKGVPLEAFEALEGDDRKVVNALRKQHRDEGDSAGTQRALFGEPTRKRAVDFATRARAIEGLPAETLDEVNEKEHRWLSLGDDIAPHWQLADAWCAAFVMEKTAATRETAIVTSIWGDLVHDRERAPKATRDAILTLANQYRFFHWALAFPQVFGDDGRGGFDVVVGNPPWERIKLQEKEFFASRDPKVAEAPNAAERKKRIAALAQSQDGRRLFDEWTAESRRAEGESALLRNTGRFPLTGRGDINTYAVFTEHAREVLSPGGRAGLVVPTGIATDDTTKDFFADTLRNQQGVCRLAGIFGFENEEFLFPSVHHAFKFAILAMTGTAGTPEAPRFLFYARRIQELDDPERCFPLAPEDIARVNPNTGTCPVFRTRRDAAITLGVYGRLPILVREGEAKEDDENPWSVSFRAMIHMANDSRLFHGRAALAASDGALQGNVWVHGDQRFVPLYEAKMIHHFDHRFATYEGQTPAQAKQGKCPELTPEQHADPARTVLPEWWVDAREVDAVLARAEWSKGWLLGWRDICRSNDSRTVIASVLPRVAVGHTMPLMFPGQGDPACLLAMLSSFVFDYVARQKVGGTHLTYSYLNQLPVLPPERFEEPAPWSPSETLSQYVRARVLELTYTAHDMAPWARDLGCTGAPFRWDEARRFELRCELDAAMFALYGLARDEVEHVMDSFPVIREKDQRAHGEYRTKRVILERFDALTGPPGAAVAVPALPPAAPAPPPPPPPPPAVVASPRARPTAPLRPKTPTEDAPMTTPSTPTDALCFEKVVLEHYRGFAEPAVVPLDPRLTVLVGTNGSGKTTILQALALAAQSLHAKLSKEKAGRLDPAAIHPARERAAVTVHATYGAARAEWTLAVAREGATPPARSDLKGLAAIADALTDEGARPLVVYYPDNRAAAQTPTSAGRKAEEKPTDAYDHALQANTDFLGFFEWFQQLDADEVYERQEKGDAWRDPRLAQVRRAIERALGTDDKGDPLYTRLRIERRPRHRMVVDKRGQRVEVDDLSAGERSLLVLAGDLAHRLAIVNPKAPDPLAMPAVVLVDEVELHLHPSWQRRVIGALRETFPACQWVVTTHSPQVLSSVPWRSVLVVRDFQVSTSPRPTEGRDSNAILAEVLGDVARPHHIEEQIEDISRRIDEEDFAGAEAAIATLAETLTESDSEVVGLRTRLSLMRGE